MSDAARVVVRAGRHARKHCPLRVAWSGEEQPAALMHRGLPLAVQRDGDQMAFVLDALEAEAEAALVPSGGDGVAGAVELADDGSTVHVALDGEPLTAYRYAGVPARPYLWPVLAPGGIPVTRAWPMAPDVAGETHDHPHHRSLYFAFGSVNGTDNWSEEPGHGHTVHRSVDEVVSGPVFGRLVTTSEWTNSEGGTILTQRAAMTFWRGSATVRLIDVDLTLLATEGDVVFGDTKEGGLVTVRVASSLDVPRGGRIENAYGGIDEDETWGRSAHWCDYSGVVEGEPVGVAVMDHPSSFRHPTYWHVRDYGLMAANPFALSEYTGGAKDGTHRLRAGDALRFVYRVALHRGSAAAADVRGLYLDFVSPPEVIAA